MSPLLSGSRKSIVQFDMRSTLTTRALWPSATLRRASALLLLVVMVLAPVAALATPSGDDGCCCSSAPRATCHMKAIPGGAASQAHDCSQPHAGIAHTKACVHLTCAASDDREAAPTESIASVSSAVKVPTCLAVASWTLPFASGPSQPLPCHSVASSLPGVAPRLLPLLI